MNKKIIFIYFLQLYFSKNINEYNDLNGKKNYELNGIYTINSISNQLFLSTDKNMLVLSNKKKHFRLVLIESNFFYIELRGTNRRIGLDKNNNLKIFTTKNNIENKTLWKLININATEFFVQSKFNHRFIEEKNNHLECSNNIDYNISNNNKTLYQNFIFKFVKLFEEGKLTKKYLKFVNKEPIDILIKYIDLSDKNLNRIGIKQIYKDVDNEEIRYSIRSIIQYLPWIRKIYILMPNEKVKCLKILEEIEDKIIYIKDKDLLGFESANIHSFTFNLYKLENLGISKNFIYMEDDFFIGKELKKTDFFYYDEKERKVVPYLLTYFFHVLNKTNVLNEYYYKSRNINSIHPHSDEGWKFSILSTQKYFMEKYKIIIINTKFTHNTIAENVEDLKNIFREIQNYEYINETLYSKERHILTLNQPQFFNLYLLNIIKRKVHSIPYAYIPVELINKYKLNKDLFVLNTGGNHIPSKRHYKFQKKIMEKRFSIKTHYEKSTEKKKNAITFIKRNYIIAFKLSLIFNLIKIYISLIISTNFFHKLKGLNH